MSTMLSPPRAKRARTIWLAVLASVLFVTASLIVWSKTSKWPGRPPEEPVEQTKPLSFLFWPVDTETRVEPGSFTRSIDGHHKIRLRGIAGETLVGQLALRSTADLVEVRFTGSDIGDLVTGRYISAATLGFQFGQYLPVDETGVMTADPLFDGASVSAPRLITIPILLTVLIPPDLPGGRYVGGIEAIAGIESHYVDLEIRILETRPTEQIVSPPIISASLDPFVLASRYKTTVGSAQHLDLIEQCAAEARRMGVTSLTIPTRPRGWRLEPLSTAGWVRAIREDEPAKSFRYESESLNACVEAAHRGEISQIRVELDDELLATENPDALHLPVPLGEIRRWCWRTFLGPPLAEATAELPAIVRVSLNGWSGDVFEQPGGEAPSGAGFLLYPGPSGPIPSMRSTMIRQGLQDVAAHQLAKSILQGLRTRRSTDPDREGIDRAKSTLERIVEDVRTSKIHAAQGRSALNDLLSELPDLERRATSSH